MSNSPLVLTEFFNVEMEDTEIMLMSSSESTFLSTSITDSSDSELKKRK